MNVNWAYSRTIRCFYRLEVGADFAGVCRCLPRFSGNFAGKVRLIWCFRRFDIVLKGLFDKLKLKLRYKLIFNLNKNDNLDFESIFHKRTIDPSNLFNFKNASKNSNSMHLENNPLSKISIFGKSLSKCVFQI